MSTFPGSPRLISGALIAIDQLTQLRDVVVFQYNPDTMTRKLDARAVSQEGDRGEATRLTGAPKESITLSVEIDAADQLDQNDAVASALGLHPTLAALELMLYPKSSMVVANDVLSAIGTIEVIPIDGPMILFVWGATRVLPVRLTGLSITEEAYDPLLNPIRAKVDLALAVLSYQDLSLLDPARALFMAHHMTKELLANANPFSKLSSLGASLKL
jgi:hypothetical protein